MRPFFGIYVNRQVRATKLCAYWGGHAQAATGAATLELSLLSNV